jgi:aminoacylase
MDSESAISRFSEFLRIRSVSAEGPVTGAYAECVAWLKDWALSIGLTCRVLELVHNKPILVATWTGSEPALPSILLNSHYDVVPVMEEHWTQPAWEGKRADGRVYGRGAQDMKCVCVQYLLAIGRLKSAGFVPRRTMHLSYVPDEEIGGVEGMGAFINSGELAALKMGMALDEGLANPKDAYTVFYGERSPWWIVITARGPTGHGKHMLCPFSLCMTCT